VRTGGRDRLDTLIRMRKITRAKKETQTPNEIEKGEVWAYTIVGGFMNERGGETQKEK